MLPYAQKQLGFNKPPVINFLDDEDNSFNPLGKTGFYKPDDKSISVFVTNRHPKDILRSVAHELVHYKQDCDGRLTKHLEKELHDKQYAQNNPDLRQFEEEAYLKGNMIFRDWEDNYKNQPLIRIKFNMTESKLRQAIKTLVSEILQEEKKKKEEEQRADVSKVRDSAKSKELGKYKIAEDQDDSDSIPLNEWKNQELFGLLSKRFGILSEAKEMSAKDKKLAAMYPPKDKITRGDVITAAKKKGGKEEEEEQEELNEEEQKMTDSQIKKSHEIAKGIMQSQKGKKGKKLSKESAYKIGTTQAKKS